MLSDKQVEHLKKIAGSKSLAKTEAARRNANKPPKPGSRPRGRPRKVVEKEGE